MRPSGLAERSKQQLPPLVASDGEGRGVREKPPGQIGDEMRRRILVEIGKTSQR